MADLTVQLQSVGVLADPVRRRLYQHVLAESGPVSREQAAEALGVPLHTAKFHLDKLAAAGILEVECHRLSGRSGPGAGRPAKVYRRSGLEVALTVPPRRYDLAGEVLAEAVDRSILEGVPVAEAVGAAARATGRSLCTVVDTTEPAAGGGDGLRRLAGVLAGHGYEPRTEGDGLSLANCPLDRLAASHRTLVCGLNLALVEGVLDGLGADDLHAHLRPGVGTCCVTVTR